ncbi:subtilisin-like protease SBT4.3 [Impatiens glandulifera]|uniref:subtilisin-like protease SBT4.3 n=1 Tax=Impatiens glandulifera TaxID=253017 RepID=UPI001FB13FF5|nr:subtilisin-like protease SBT4.3 [Impatiens glandulifera]
MAKSSSKLSYFLLVFVVTLAIGLLCEAIDEERKVYIVYMGRLPEDKQYSANSHHISMLESLVKGTLIRSYTRSFNGFAANLTPEEAIKLESMDDVVSVFESLQYYTQTTRSWDYIGFPRNVPRNPQVESDIIIGSIDSGVVPDSKSFSDEGLDIVPKKWKGACMGGTDFPCNKKLIGARYYGFEDAWDNDGHGTHTASTAAGREVPNTSFFGIANGTARGAVPAARIAAYKVCGTSNCGGQNILAAFDDAISDGVDIITVSLGTDTVVSVNRDVIAMGSFHAMEKGILTVQAAGNTGEQGLGSVVSIAPWLFTVAASSVDRKIINKLVLGNNRTFISNALNGFSTINNNLSLAHGGTTPLKCDESSARKCKRGCVDPLMVWGKIIVCDTDDKSGAIEVGTKVGAAGIILSKATVKDLPYNVPLPASILNDSDLQSVLSYVKSTSLPTAYIQKSEIVLQDEVHAVASFSGRGPNQIFPEIFKPDITAPGLNILAAYSPRGPISDYTEFDKRSSNTRILSGTSMSCPHVTGAAAYVKSMHPDWSASAIKSALMTTAYPMNASYNVDAEFGYGAGQVNPLSATTPGLVYETFLDDYINMFCNLGDVGERLRRLFGIQKICPKGNETSPKDLNYPSMTARIHESSSFNIRFPRVVTNVGHPNSTYHSEITTGNSAIHVKVEPSILSFKKLKETKSFVVTVSGQWSKQDHISCSLVWNDGTHRVKSPIILYSDSLYD